MTVLPMHLHRVQHDHQRALRLDEIGLVAPRTPRPCVSVPSLARAEHHAGAVHHHRLQLHPPAQQRRKAHDGCGPASPAAPRAPPGPAPRCPASVMPPVRASVMLPTLESPRGSAPEITGTSRSSKIRRPPAGSGAPHRPRSTRASHQQHQADPRRPSAAAAVQRRSRLGFLAVPRAPGWLRWGTRSRAHAYARSVPPPR
jgi:hypothetical protein